MAKLNATLAHLLPGDVDQMIVQWLKEDCPAFDYGGYVVGDARTEAKLISKARGVLAGVPFFDRVFKSLGCRYGFWCLMSAYSVLILQSVLTG